MKRSSPAEANFKPPPGQPNRECGKQYQGSIAAKVLFILPRVLRVTLLQVLSKVVCGYVPTAPCTLAPPPISSCLSQDENFFSSQKAELEKNIHRSQNSRKTCSWYFNCGSVINPPSLGPKSHFKKDSMGNYTNSQFLKMIPRFRDFCGT